MKKAVKKPLTIEMDMEIFFFSRERSHPGAKEQKENGFYVYVYNKAHTRKPRTK